MSKHENTVYYENLLERASELIDETSGMSFIPKTIERLIKENDLEKLERFVVEVEGMLAQEHFVGRDILQAGSVD